MESIRREYTNGFDRVETKFEAFETKFDAFEARREASDARRDEETARRETRQLIWVVGWVTAMFLLVLTLVRYLPPPVIVAAPPAAEQQPGQRASINKQETRQ